MSTTQKPVALLLADKYEVHGFLNDQRYAKDYWCSQAAAELRRQHARIAELEAQLSAIGAGGVEPLRKSASQQAAHPAAKVIAVFDHAATQPAAQGLDAPWGDLKVAFDCDDADALWGALDAGILIFPKGWKLVETDGSAAREVAIFRVDHAPTTAEGSAVRAVIGAALAAQAKNGGAA